MLATDYVQQGVLQALLKLHSIAPDAILAGGYLRDRLEKVEVKDADFFCTDLGFGLEVDRLKELFPEARLENYSNWLEYTSPDVTAVWHLGTADGVPLQLIELTPGRAPEERVKEHDFGICQVWCDGAAIRYTTEFFKDFTTNAFTLTQCESRREFERSMKRFARLSQKYPNHELVIPEEFAKWQTTH